jgi:hypothetical protein
VVEKCKRMAVAVVKCGKPVLMRSTLDLIDECSNEAYGYVYNKTFFEETIPNPSRVRTKGCGTAKVSSSHGRNKLQRRRNDGATTTNMGRINSKNGRKPHSCGICKTEGHNHTSCPVLSQQIQSDNEGEDENDVDDDLEEYGNIGTVEMVRQLLLLSLKYYSFFIIIHDFYMLLCLYILKILICYAECVMVSGGTGAGAGNRCREELELVIWNVLDM